MEGWVSDNTEASECLLCGNHDRVIVDEAPLCEDCIVLLSAPDEAVAPEWATLGAKKIRCKICGERGDRFVDQSGRPLPCGCSICVDCFKGWAKAKIDDMCTVVKCPMQGKAVRSTPRCTAPLNQKFIECALADFPDELRRYRAMVADMSEDPSRKSCPGCQLVTVHDGDIPDIVCISCDLQWCFACHAPQHAGVSCADFIMERSKKETKEHKWQEKHTRQCPSCKTAIQRAEGCDHMHCTLCDTHFCYACRTRLYDGDTAPYYHRRKCIKQRKNKRLATAITIAALPLIIPVTLVFVVGVGVYQTASMGAKAAKRRLSGDKVAGAAGFKDSALSAKQSAKLSRSQTAPVS